MTSEAQKRASRKYIAKIPQIKASIYPKDADLIPHIEKRKAQFGSSAAYIKALIRADMERELEDSRNEPF